MTVETPSRPMKDAIARIAESKLGRALRDDEMLHIMKERSLPGLESIIDRPMPAAFQKSDPEKCLLSI